jgi:antitoxin YefM
MALMKKIEGKTKSLRAVDANLRRLSRSAQARKDRYVILDGGQPQSVLLDYKEYQGLNAVLDLLRKPKELEDIRVGLAQLNAGERRTWDEVVDEVHKERAKAASTEQLASQLATREVNKKVVAKVLTRLIHKLGKDLIASEVIDYIPDFRITRAKREAGEAAGKDVEVRVIRGAKAQEAGATAEEVAEIARELKDRATRIRKEAIAAEKEQAEDIPDLQDQFERET